MSRAAGASSAAAGRYELYYWPGLPGRGEFVRLALEDSDAPYDDIGRLPEKRGGGSAAVQAALDVAGGPHPAFAPPLLHAGRLWIAQTANILLYLGGRHGLAPRDAAGRHWVHQLQLTIADLVAEVHDTHHPVAAGAYYEDQKGPAKRRAKDFREERLPKFLDYFEQVLARNAARGPGLHGASITYADLSLAHVVDGLRYAFPKATARALADTPRVAALRELAFSRPRLKRYLASSRRQPFNATGIFRHYPELDG